MASPERTPPRGTQWMLSERLLVPGSQIILGCVWLLLGMLKAADPEPFRLYLRDWLDQSHSASRAIGWGVTGLELALGTALIAFRTGTLARTALGLSFLAALLSSMGTIMAGPGLPDCGCFGGAAQATFGRRVAVSGILMFTSVAMLSCGTRGPVREVE